LIVLGNNQLGLNVYSKNNAPNRLVALTVMPAYDTLINGIQTINTSSTSLTVDSTTGFPASGTLRVLNATSTTENGKFIYLHYTSVTATSLLVQQGYFIKL